MTSLEFYIGATLLVWLLVYFFVIMDDALNARSIQPPQFLAVKLRGEKMADILTYRVSVGPVVNSDVVTRELSVYVNDSDVAREVRAYEPTATELGDVLVEQNSFVSLRVVDIDDAGNRSEPAVLEFVAVDTIAPAKPGEFGVTLVSENSTDAT